MQEYEVFVSIQLAPDTITQGSMFIQALSIENAIDVAKLWHDVLSVFGARSVRGAKVLGIYDLEGNLTKDEEVLYNWDPTFIYREGETAFVKDFDKNRFDCTRGIHNYLTFEEEASPDA